MNHQAINKYRNMWVLTLFDLPTETKKQRKAAQRFRKQLLDNGFNMFQFSIYVRSCASRQNSEVHRKRVKHILPEYGHVCIMEITDKQFANMEIYYNRGAAKAPDQGQQLELF